jgi:hypothetical protein
MAGFQPSFQKGGNSVFNDVTIRGTLTIGSSKKLKFVADTEDGKGNEVSLKYNSDGALIIDVVGNVTGNATGLSGTPNITAGTVTATQGANMQNLLTEEVNITAGKLSDNTNINVEDGMVHLFTTTETTTSTPNIRYNASTSLNSKMSIGQSIVVTLITTAAVAAFSANITIDGAAVTENWIGGSAPTNGGVSGVDVHSFTIIKTADATFTVIGMHITTS